MGQTPTSLPRFSDDLEAILLRFDADWKEPSLEQLRAVVPAEADMAFLLELIRIDAGKRLARGHTLDEAFYLQAFPELQVQPEFKQKLRAITFTPMLAGASDAPGVVIAGRYKLLEEVGEGGMGTVWLAQQSEPVRRLVAIKLIKSGMDSKGVLARFDAERQALAMMDHPNIAKVLDGGLTEDRRPFFVMELVKGTPITKFCDERKLSLKERLELFVPVCQAIQHAHQKGIIHRDIKPSNVLVTLYDDKPVPKVIDFGVAKATGSQLTEQTINTGFGTIVGTPEYMSPEQASMNHLDIDTRSDVYALGVLLYELLTGTTPVDKKSLKQAALMEVLRIVREVEAPKPSTKLSSSEALPSIAANRHTEPAKLSKMMKGELDWIVLKALSKERERRYETANGFAADVLRYLSGEPVTAVPPSASYRLKKFIRRYRPQLIAASLILLALVAGIVGTTISLFEARRQERLANDARKAEAKRADGERLAKEESLKRLGQIKNGFNTLSAVFRDLDPNYEEKEGKTLRVLLGERLVEAGAQLEGDVVGDPELVADLQSQVGNSLRELGHLEPADTMLTKAYRTHERLLGADHLKTIDDVHNQAMLLQARGRYPEALERYQAVLAARQRQLGDNHLETLNALNNLATLYLLTGRYTDAEPLFKQAIEAGRRALGADHKDVLTGMNNLGTLYYFQTRYKDAEPLYRAVLDLRRQKLGETHTDTLAVLNNLSNLYTAQGKYDAAEESARLAIVGYRTKLGDDHPHTLTAVLNLALLNNKMGRTDAAEKLYLQVIDGGRRRLGNDHPDVLRPMQDLAVLYWKTKRLDKSVPLLEQVVERSKVKLGIDHPDTLLSMANLGVNYRDAGRFDDALKLLEEVDRRRDGKPLLAWVADSLVVTYVKAGRKTTAIEYLVKAASVARQKYPPESTALGSALANLGGDLLDLGSYDAAEPLLRECLAIREKTQPDAWNTFNIKSLLGGALSGKAGRVSDAKEKAKLFTEAEPLLLQGYDGMNQRENTIPAAGKTRLPQALDRLIQLYTETNKPEDVKKWQAEKERISKTPEKK